MPHIIVHFYFAFGARRRDTGDVLNDLFLTTEKVIADSISMCVAIGASLLIGQVLVQTFAIPWTVIRQPPLSVEFPRQEYWSGLPFPLPGDRPKPGIKARSPALQTDSLSPEPPGKPLIGQSTSLFFTWSSTERTWELSREAPFYLGWLWSLEDCSNYCLKVMILLVLTSCSLFSHLPDCLGCIWKWLLSPL